MIRKLFILLILPLQALSQPTPLKDYDVPTAQISGTTLYTQENFRTYLLSGGDMIMEYGLKNLLVQELRYPDEHVTVQMYEMNDPSSAYGLYSVSVMGCKAKGIATAFDCYNGTEYFACYGRFYYHLSSENPRPADKNLFASLSGIMIRNNPDTTILLPSVFTSDLIRRFGKDPYCTKGVLGVQHSPFPWQDLFTMVRATMYAVILPFDRDVYFAQINFTSAADQNTFLKRAGLMAGFNPLVNTTTSDGLYREYRPIDDTHIYFLECQLPFSISALVP